MKKNVLLIFLFLFLLSPFACSKPPNSPEWRTVVEFKYKRTKPILDNNATGPKGFSIWNDILGGNDIQNLTYLGDNEWMGAISLVGTEEAPYQVYTIDMKVTGAVYLAVAETFYAKVQGTSEWMELTCVGPKTNGEVEGFTARFYLYDGVITVPSAVLAYNKDASVWAHALDDMKVAGAYEPVAGTFYAKAQGNNSEWEELTCIEPEFYLDGRFRSRRNGNNGKVDTCAEATEDKERGDTL